MKRNYFCVAAISLLLSCGLTACSGEELLEILGLILSDDDTTIVADDKGLGWLSKEEHTERIEDDIRLNAGEGSDIDKVTSLPVSIDLSPCLPPIGNQGQYGTCCAWSSAYYGRTWHYALDNNLRTKDLTDRNIFSPSDVFRSLESNQKGKACAGTSFEFVLDNFVQRGIATLAVSPYSSNNLDCDCKPSASATQDAAKYKIKNYREVQLDVPTLKRYLCEKHIVIFGAKLSDNFMYLKDASVIRNHTTYNATGMHAYHAMVIVGYDDNRGPNGAFRVVNSWGKNWGDRGYAWVDYKFFVSGEFAYCAFIINTNESGSGQNVTPSEDGEIDLIASKCTDVDFNGEEYPEESDDPTWRTLFYDVHNAGSEPVLASNTWGIAYVLYNAYNAQEYQIVLTDLYSDEIGNLQKGEYNGNWSPEQAYEITGLKAQGFSISNIDVPAQYTVCEAVYGKDVDSFEWTYKMPDVTGEYYLVLMADAFGSINNESNKDNNYYFLMTADRRPLHIEHGVIKTEIVNNKSLSFEKVKISKNQQMPCQTPVGPNTVNTYSPEEIAAMLKHHVSTGQIRNKALEWSFRNSAMPRKCARK